MILKYNLSDNRLEKKDATLFPNHLQDNIVLEFDKNEGLPNTKYYAYIKTSDAVKKVRIKKKNGVYSCELPPFVSHYSFFKLQVVSVIDNRKLVTNELIIPFRTLDYLDYNRSMNKVLNRGYPLCDNDFKTSTRPTQPTNPSGSDGSSGGGSVPSTDSGYYNKEEIDGILSSKADLVHKHQHEDIVDWEEEISEDLDLFLFSLTNRIREI